LKGRTAVPEKTPTRRRWFRFSLRTLFVVVTLACVALGMYVKRVRERYIAIETIKEWGGDVEFVNRFATSLKEERDRMMATSRASRMGEPRPEFPENLPQGSAWQRRMFGKYGKFLGSKIHAIQLGKTAFTPEGVKIDVWVLEPLAEVKQLTLVDPINVGAMQRLPRLPDLEKLHLIGGSYIDDEALQCLSRMPNLKVFHISAASLSDNGLARIGAARGLTRVRLFGCELTDNCLIHLIRLPILSSLWLNESNVSDAAIPDLAQLRGLQILNVSGTRLTMEGVARLREALPNCQIQSDYP
jgi:hypothetical protein